MDHVSFDQMAALLPFGVAGLMSWAIWLFRRTMSHRAGPITGDYAATVSVVVPCFREDPALVRQCLDTWLREPIDELIIVVDVGDADVLEMLYAHESAERLTVIEFVHRGKRSALAKGIRAASSEIVVLCDSDTAWTEGLVTEMLRPFADPAVGGVGSRQLVAASETSPWRRVAAWMLNIRYLDYVPAMGAKGAVPCLSGRTAAYRREVIDPLLPQLEHEIFLGRECIAGDDGRLTWLTLAAGYQTVYQPTAIALSMFPATLHAFIKQRTRWSRNSYRCYATAAWKGWLWDQPFITVLTVLQNLMTPITMGLAMVFLIFSIVSYPPLLAMSFIAWVFIGRAIRGISHLRENPREIVMLPLVTIATIVLALPIKAFACVTMNKQGWLTRNAQQVGGEGQDNESLAGHALAA